MLGDIDTDTLTSILRDELKLKKDGRKQALLLSLGIVKMFS